MRLADGNRYKVLIREVGRIGCTGILKFVVVARTLVRIGYKRTEVRTTLKKLPKA